MSLKIKVGIWKTSFSKVIRTAHYWLAADRSLFSYIIISPDFRIRLSHATMIETLVAALKALKIFHLDIIYFLGFLAQTYFKMLYDYLKIVNLLGE